MSDYNQIVLIDSQKYEIVKSLDSGGQVFLAKNVTNQT